MHLFSQDPRPESYAFVDAVGAWESGSLRVRTLEGGSGRCTVYRPDIGEILPVYVADRYEGLRARTFLECDERQIAAYIAANVDAVREVADRVKPDVALANHLVMGPVILARALSGSAPYAVKVHGSALEYTVKRDPQRFLGYAREGVARASAVLVGSRHTAESLWEALGDSALRSRTRLAPPGVDVERFAPREPAEARAALRRLVNRLRESAAQGSGQPQSSFVRDEQAAAEAIERIVAGGGELVVFVGKLIASKGVDLLLAAWPLVLRQRPSARLLIVGFGAFRDALEQLAHALHRGDLAEARQIAIAGRALECEPGEARPLAHLLAFLDSLGGEDLDGYFAAARHLSERVVFSGRLDHEELADVLPACDVLVVPSTFPEAFGMVAAEAAASGVPPVSARHSGLAEVSEALARRLPSGVSEWLSFPVDDYSVRAIAERVLAWMGADAGLRAEVRARLVGVAGELWSWERVARNVIAAANGQLQALDAPR